MSEQIPGPVGNVTAPRIPRGRTSDDDERAQEAIDRVGGVVGEYHREKVSEARVLGFAAGVVVGIAWMLIVGAVAVYW